MQLTKSLTLKLILLGYRLNQAGVKPWQTRIIAERVFEAQQKFDDASIEWPFGKAPSEFETEQEYREWFKKQIEK